MPEQRAPDTKGDVKWAIALLLVTILGLSGAYNTSWQLPGTGREDLGAITTDLLSGSAQMVLLELVGVALVAALVAALVIAIRERPAPPGGGA